MEHLNLKTPFRSFAAPPLTLSENRFPARRTRQVLPFPSPPLRTPSDPRFGRDKSAPFGTPLVGKTPPRQGRCAGPPRPPPQPKFQALIFVTVAAAIFQSFDPPASGAQKLRYVGTLVSSEETTPLTIIATEISRKPCFSFFPPQNSPLPPIAASTSAPYSPLQRGHFDTFFSKIAI